MASSSGDQGPLFTLDLSQHGALPMAYLATDELKKDGEQVKKYLVYMAYSLEKKMSKVSTKQVVLKTHYMGCNF